MKKCLKSICCFIITVIILIISNINIFAVPTLNSRTKSDTIIASNSCYYYFINFDSERYMSADSVSTGNDLYQINYNLLVPKFRFIFARTANGFDYYNIIPVDDTSLRLDVKNAVDYNGAHIQFYVNNPSYSQAQEFRFINNGDGTYSIMPRLSSTKVLTVDASTNIVLSTNTNANNQKWVIKRDRLVTTYASTTTTGYSPAAAGRCALRHGDNPNFVDYPDTGYNCTNFASQCLYAGGFEFYPESASVLTSVSDVDHWFTKNFLNIGFRTAYSWSKAGDFYTHMTDNQRFYRKIQYQTGWDAFMDYDYIHSNITLGDVFQYGDMNEIEHSMVVYNKTTCDGKHKGEVNSCARIGSEELIYAQNVSATGGNYKNGHVSAVLMNYANKNFMFYDVISYF